MDIISLRRKIDRLIHTHSSSLIPDIEKSGFACACCGWCCCRNFDIKITENILRPSNAISIFPGDIRRIIKITGCKWDEVAEPDIYSCVLEKEDVVVVGWILKRRKDNEKSCVFYRNGLCTIYSCRPLICRCYPFFMGENGIEIMYCNSLKLKEIMVRENAVKISKALKRYEIKKLRSYIRIIKQIGDKLKLNIDFMKSLPDDFSGNVIVFDGETISKNLMIY